VAQDTAHWMIIGSTKISAGKLAYVRSSFTCARCSPLGPLLLWWFRNAVKWSKIQSEAANDLAGALDEDMVTQWKVMVKAWESDKSKPDPYEEQEEGKLSFDPSQ
jgi:hypothetical protein